MDKEIFTLKLEGQNKTFEVSNLTMNGTNYVSETEVDTSNWPKWFKLTATNQEGQIKELWEYARLLQQEQYDWDGGKFYLAFAPVSEQEVKNAEFKAYLEYLAMMTDVDMEQ